MVEVFHSAKKKKNGDQILLPIPTGSLGKSSAFEKNGQSSWSPLCAEESTGILEHGPRKRDATLEIL